MKLSASDTFQSLQGITAFHAGKRQVNASKAFSERQPAIPEARASSRVGCFVVGGRLPEVQSPGAQFAVDEGRCGGSSLVDSSDNQQRCQPDNTTGLHVL